MLRAALAGNRSVCLTRYRLSREAANLSSECVQRLAAVGKGESQKRKQRKEEVLSSLSALFPIGLLQVPVLCFPGLLSFPTSLRCQPRAVHSASVVGVLAAVHVAAQTPSRVGGWRGGWEGGRPVKGTQARILQRYSLLSRSHQGHCGRLKSPK